MYCALATLSLFALAVAAGSHNRRLDDHQRHYGRMPLSGAYKTPALPPNLYVETPTKRDECTHGDWNCAGSELQRCNWGDWIAIQNCTGDNIVCSTQQDAVGCVWTWFVDSSTTSQDTRPTPSATTSLVFDASGAVSASDASATASQGLDDHEPTVDDGDDDDENSSLTSSSIRSTTSHDATITSSATFAIPTVQDTVTSQIGDGLWAGHKSGTRQGGKTSFASDASATDSWDTGGGYETASTTATDASVSYAAATASSTTAMSNSASTPTSEWSAPHYVIYADSWLGTMPDVSELGPFNRFILAFWEASTGAVDNVQAWASWDKSYRDRVIEEYHDAGIAIMVAAFGSTDLPTTSGKDAKQVAQELASFVKAYNLDGVDIDYEDMSAMNSARAVAWIVEFQTELRNLLPWPYIISHAPVAPWFTSANDYADGSYVSIHQQVGGTIDFYNVQFYNQGADQYVTCETLVTDSGSEWPSTSVFEINSYTGVALDKIVIGKPLSANSASNGYMSASDLQVCVGEAKEKGWNGGIMFWQWSDEAPSVMATARGGA
ncbi:hypothetical protein I312_104369 [Cryptococcus bacillisporus CA1280]|uniref:uncharacterized protein n=1 Tax=Cryptococcus bacillisporus CA1280 TaxID=1296109 RepID=UPI0033681B91